MNKPIFSLHKAYRAGLSVPPLEGKPVFGFRQIVGAACMDRGSGVDPCILFISLLPVTGVGGNFNGQPLWETGSFENGSY